MPIMLHCIVGILLFWGRGIYLTRMTLETLRSPKWSKMRLSEGQLRIPLWGALRIQSVVEPPPSRFMASLPPKTRTRCASSGMLIPMAFPLARPSTVRKTVVPLGLVKSTLRGCLVAMKALSQDCHETVCPFFNNSGPETRVVPFRFR